MKKLRNFAPQILIGLLALLLTIFSLKSGYVHNDYLQNNTLAQQDFSKSIFRTTVTLDSSQSVDLVEQGSLPWWTSPNARIAFFRPIADITHFIDFIMWPWIPEPMHLQSILWYGLICSLSFVFFKKIIKSKNGALIAAYLFTADFNHFTTVTWLADRQRLLVILFGFASVVLFHLWRVHKREHFRYLSYVGFLMALLTAESGIASLGYIIAYAIFIEGLKLKKVTALLAPYTVLFIGWWIPYSAAGYGVKSTGFYTNPLHEPILFIQLAFERIPILFVEQWFKPSMFVPTKLWIMPDPTLYNVLPEAGRIFYWTLSLIVMLAVTAIFYRYLKNDKVARFFLASSFFSLFLASTSVLLEGRLLIFAGVGMSGILAMLIDHILLKRKKHPSIVVIIFILFTLVMQGVISPIRLFAMTRDTNPMKGELVRMTNLPYVSSNSAIFAINAPSPVYLSYRSPMNVNESLPPAQALAPGYKILKIKRTAANALEIAASEPGSSQFYELDKKNGYKDFDRAINKLGYMSEKKITVVRNFHIEVLENDKNSGNIRVKFTFNLPLEDRSYSWVKWNWETSEYEAFTLPQVGESIVL